MLCKAFAFGTTLTLRAMTAAVGFVIASDRFVIASDREALQDKFNIISRKATASPYFGEAEGITAANLPSLLLGGKVDAERTDEGYSPTAT